MEHNRENVIVGMGCLLIMLVSIIAIIAGIVVGIMYGVAWGVVTFFSCELLFLIFWYVRARKIFKQQWPKN